MRRIRTQLDNRFVANKIAGNEFVGKERRIALVLLVACPSDDSVEFYRRSVEETGQAKELV